MALSASGVTIKVTPEILRNKAEEVSAEISEVQNCFESIKSTVDRSKSYWIGEAGDLHRKMFENQSDDIDTILKRFMEHPRDLRQIAQNYLGVEQEVEALARELPADVII